MSNPIRNRAYSLIVPWFMDGGIVLLQTAMPLLAVRMGASAMLLGTIGVVAQSVRLPLCFTSGHLSERFGRAAVCVPAACICAAGCGFLGLAKSNTQVLLLYTLAMAAIGGFYPPLQAMIGDVSERGQLRKNLGMFNVGWCVGSAVLAVAARWLLAPGIHWLCFTGAALNLIAAGLILTWRRGTVSHQATQEAPEQAGSIADYGSLLPIARIGHFMGFYGYATIRVIFPKVGISQLHWSEATVATVTALLLVGLGTGILACNTSPWWRGKLWPLIAALLVMAITAAPVCWVSSPVLLGAAFFGFGFALSVVYTAALYYGLSSRKARGKNTGIHEGLVAAGNIAGCLLGGLVAKAFALTTPFALLACLSAVSIPVSFLSRKR